MSCVPKRIFLSLIAGILIAQLVPLSVQAAASNDGRRFDQGASMTAPAERASEATSRVASLRGQWQVTLTSYNDGQLLHEAEAVSEITWMNRGHGLLERFHCAEFDTAGHALDTLAFLVHTPSSDQWELGVANSFTENIRKYHGGFAGEDLVLETIIRGSGGPSLNHYRVTLKDLRDESFQVLAESAIYPGEFTTVWTRDYRRHTGETGLLPARDDYGVAAPDLPQEAHEFDFILGEWDEAHELTLPNGQVAKFPVHGTAVRALNGHAIMEHAWYDVDPSVPDAATTIVRIYNRAMRRWESMYSTNRFNSVLYFGGVREEDRIVLHSFEADATSGPISYWTFHDMQENSYGWYADTSRDRGESFQKTWIIQATRKAME